MYIILLESILTGFTFVPLFLIILNIIYKKFFIEYKKFYNSINKYCIFQLIFFFIGIIIYLLYYIF